MQISFPDCSDIEPIASGGQKVVYKATHTQFGHVVLKHGKFNSISQAERIQREIDALKEINSPYYPKQHHFILDLPNQEFYIIEQKIEGKTLRETLSLFDTEDKIFTLLNHLVEGLDIIWNKNIVHRDLKPENIIIKPDLTPCILDLGIARFLDKESLTKTLQAMGPCTPIYASPEQLLNKKDIIDIRSDFFSLGIIVLELCLGFHPYDSTYVGNGLSIPENILSSFYIKASAKKGTSKKIDQLTQKLLMTEPFQRYRNAVILKQNLA